MSSSSDSEIPAGRGDKRGWGVWISLAVVGLALVVLLVLPGFLAAGFSRMENDCWSQNGELYWDDGRYQSGLGSHYRVNFWIFAPSGWLMKHSESVRRLYNWEYRSAGGHDFED